MKRYIIHFLLIFSFFIDGKVFPSQDDAISFVLNQYILKDEKNHFNGHSKKEKIMPHKKFFFKQDKMPTLKNKIERDYSIEKLKYISLIAVEFFNGIFLKSKNTTIDRKNLAYKKIQKSKAHFLDLKEKLKRLKNKPKLSQSDKPKAYIPAKRDFPKRPQMPLPKPITKKQIKKIATAPIQNIQKTPKIKKTIKIKKETLKNLPPSTHALPIVQRRPTSRKESFLQKLKSLEKKNRPITKEEPYQETATKKSHQLDQMYQDYQRNKSPP